MKLNPKKTMESLITACGLGSGPTFYSPIKRIAATSPANFRKELQRKASSDI
ncbi:MAG: hypothetical protein JXR25_01470 [Pontiellaceae bacterium]|nr:hypothetical protein [Pontiellaceae bacterium]MBN2783468.1 hypothetical protein [Pontiellaceae bacterium]